MGMIKGFYVDAKGDVHTYWAQERIQDPIVPTKEAKRRNRIRCRLIRGSVYAAGILANIFALSLAGSNPHWFLGVGGAVVCIGWVSLVIGVNGGDLYVE